MTPERGVAVSLEDAQPFMVARAPTHRSRLMRTCFGRSDEWRVNGYRHEDAVPLNEFTDRCRGVSCHPGPTIEL
jgi:hypothetical protein